MKLSLLVISFIGAGFLAGFEGILCFILPYGNNLFLYAVGAMLGFFLAPSLTLGIEFACEVGFPVGESYSNGMIQIIGNILTITFVVLLSTILDNT